MNKHYIYCHQAFDLNKGGTVGYTSTLYESYLRFGDFVTKNRNQINFLFPNIDKTERVRNFLLSDFTDERFRYIESFTNPSGLQNLINERKRWFKEIIPPSEIAKIDKERIKSIHVHGAYNFLPVFNFLKSQNLHEKTLKILTTHNPYKPEFEDIELISRGREWSDPDKRTLKYFFQERDKWAFYLSDILIFPSEYSMEGYYKTWPEFKEIVKNKKVYFCTTGGQKKKSTISPMALRQSLQIPENAIVLLYLGRFVNVRGYDILIKAAKEVLKQKDLNVYFIVVGESFKTPEITDRRWIQIPFSNSPGDYLEMADAALCPNRGSLFDLSMIEILASATPLICSNVGGYKYLRDRTQGVIYAEPECVNSLVSAINSFICMPHSKHIAMGQENYRLYTKELSLKSFWKNYSSCIDQIYSDFNVIDKSNNANVQEIPFTEQFKNIYKSNFIINTQTKQTISQTLKVNKNPLSPKNTNTNVSNKEALTNHLVIPKNPNLSSTQRKLRKLIRNPKLYFSDFFKKHFF